jgi:hypothetical protein
MFAPWCEDGYFGARRQYEQYIVTDACNVQTKKARHSNFAAGAARTFGTEAPGCRAGSGAA